MNNWMVRNSKVLAYMATESTHNVFFHFIDTVKTRS